MSRTRKTPPPEMPKYARARKPDRATYDRARIDPILKAGLVGHFGFVADGRPMVIPMAYALDGDRIFLHGASKTRAIKGTAGLPGCLTVTLIDGLVAARSAFHHSVNYRSVLVHGTAHAVTDPDKFDRALQLITEHLLPGRYAEVRPITAKERKATGVLELRIDAASAKIRSGPPVDDDEDHGLGLWGGILPITTALGRGVPDGHTPADMAEPPSFSQARMRFSR
ncbi:MAG: pyridoxamine 5'-phosphate oxidase family protein [Albidovulum sp.]